MEADRGVAGLSVCLEPEWKPGMAEEAANFMQELQAHLKIKDI